MRGRVVPLSQQFSHKGAGGGVGEGEKVGGCVAANLSRFVYRLIDKLN